MVHIFETKKTGEGSTTSLTNKPVILEIQIGTSPMILSPIHIAKPVVEQGDLVTVTPHRERFAALWDTGATVTSVTPRVVQAVGLDECGYKPVRGVHGEVRKLKAYRAAIVLAEKPLDLESEENTIAFPETQVAKLDEDSAQKLGGIDVIVGMDIILQGDSWISGENGERWFSFCYPSPGFKISLKANVNEMADELRTNGGGNVTRNDRRRSNPANFRPRAHQSRNKKRARRRKGK